MAKSIRVVVPPKAAARVPVSKSSLEVVPPKGMSRCVCTSMPPGSSSMPEASITRSAVSAGNAGGDFADAFAVDQDVGRESLLGCDDRAVANECGQRASCGLCLSITSSVNAMMTI